MAVAALSDSTPGRDRDPTARALAEVGRAGPAPRRRGPGRSVPGSGAEAISGPSVASAMIGTWREARSADRGPLQQRHLEQRRAGGAGALGVERVRGLAEQDHPRHAERRRRADHRADVLGVLERHEQRAALGPGGVVGPLGHLGHADQQQRRVRPRGVELPGTAGRPAGYQVSPSAGGGAPFASVSQASTRSGNRARTSAISRGPASSARPCLRMPRPPSRSRQSLNVGFASLDTSRTGPA